MSQTKDLIFQEEQKAKDKHLHAVKQITIEPFSEELQTFFQQSILPVLVQLGFDREISLNIFKVSGRSWESIKGEPAPQLKLYATFLRDIRKIRDGLASKNTQKNARISQSSNRELWNLDNIEKRKAATDTLVEKLQSIPTSWIILPRAYRLLTDEDSHCLTVYLQRLSKESNLAFKKILARILIEYVGNYNVKFINPNLPRELMCDAVFYGYAAMFWKNIQKPPPGLEDMLISQNFLSWAKAFVKRGICCDKKKEETILQMERTQNDILPARKTSLFRQKKELPPDLLYLTLRHGRPGINHAVQYFTMNRALTSNKGDKKVYRKLPEQTAIFFRVLRNNYGNEDAKAREFIQTFLSELSKAYSHHNFRQKISEQNIPDDLIFTHRRMSSMVRDFNRSVQ